MMRSVRLRPGNLEEAQKGCFGACRSMSMGIARNANRVILAW